MTKSWKGACEGVDTILMQWNQKTLGTTKRKRVSSKNQIFVTKIIIFIQNDKIKEPLRVLCQFNMMEP